MQKRNGIARKGALALGLGVCEFIEANDDVWKAIEVASHYLLAAGSSCVVVIHGLVEE